jgi:nucleotide-binding universal stress UspA family protein
MKLIKKILLATDFSKASEYVVADALEMAKIFQSEITLVYVMPKKIENKKAKELLKEFALKQLEIYNSKIRHEGVVASEPLLLKGDFSDKIVSAAKSIRANIIMIGGGEILENNLLQLGSNAEKIIKKSSKPVLVVKGKKPFRIKNILCPVDFSKESKRALKNAITMAHRFKAKLEILTVFEVSQLNFIKDKINLGQEIENIRIAYKNEFDSFLEGFNLTGLEVNKEIKQGNPSIEILKAVEAHQSDLLIIGTTGKSGINKILMGSVTEKVIRKVPCSYIALKKKNVIKLELESKIQDIEDRYSLSQQLFEDGFYKESIKEFEACLEISFMHLSSLKGLAKVYQQIGDEAKANKYRGLTTQVLDKMFNDKIESEARKYSMY